jgi:hypothetical protein
MRQAVMRGGSGSNSSARTPVRFRAIGAPQDLGVRLLAAAKAQVPAAQIEANATAAMGEYVRCA